jgi:SAM-dependent methyltransferase
MALRKRIVGRIVGQFHRPHGAAGYLAGWVMGHRSSNVERNRWVVSLLDVQPTDRILEVGFGPGLAIAALSDLTPDGTVFGVDHSDVMVRMAKKRNAAAVRAGRVDLRLAGADALPDFGAPLDKVVAVNSMGFWPEPVGRLKELHQVLRPGGTIAIASQPRCPGATAQTSAKAGLEIEERLHAAGFSPVRAETLKLDPPVICVVAVSSDAPHEGSGTHSGSDGQAGSQPAH